MKSRYTLFPQDVYLDRLDRARKQLHISGIDACLCIAPEHQFYFGGYDSWTGVNSPQAMIFTSKQDAPTLLIRDVDLPLALESTWIQEIRTYQLNSESFSERVYSILLEKGVRSGTVGMEFQSYALPHSLGQDLGQSLAGFELIDVTTLLGTLRLIKSDPELTLIKAAGEYADLGLRAMGEFLQAGMSEIKLAAHIESAVRSAGSDYWAIPVELTSGFRSAGCHGTPRAKAIETGDLVHAEFAGVCNRYHATGIQTVCCGPANEQQRELYQYALQSLRAGIVAITPGVCVADVEQASLQPLVRHGLEHAAMMRFGYGIGIAYPPIWLETLQISRDFDTRLENGMAFVLHSCLELPEQNLGVILGGTYALENGQLKLLAGAGQVELLEI